MEKDKYVSRSKYPAVLRECIALRQLLEDGCDDAGDEHGCGVVVEPCGEHPREDHQGEDEETTWMGCREGKWVRVMDWNKANVRYSGDEGK